MNLKAKFVQKLSSREITVEINGLYHTIQLEQPIETEISQGRPVKIVNPSYDDGILVSAVRVTIKSSKEKLRKKGNGNCKGKKQPSKKTDRQPKPFGRGHRR